jgi:CheY-like chemotaxis protein
MSTLVSDSMLARMVESARKRVVEGLLSLGKSLPEETLKLAADLHTIAGEAAMLNKPELARAAADGEDAVRVLGGTGKADDLIPCMRSLRRLGYLLQEASESSERDSAPSDRADRRGPQRLLVVDDSPVAALALADVFEMDGFSVRVASTFDKAVEEFSDFTPSVLVSDVHMPNLDVAGLCRAFRLAASDRKTAVVLVSGRAEGELRERLDQIRPDAFVSKLSGAAAVVTRVKAICRELLA